MAIAHERAQMEPKSPPRPRPPAKRPAPLTASSPQRHVAVDAFAPERLCHALAPLCAGRGAVGAQADLREARDLGSEGAGGLESLAGGNHAVGEAEGEGLLRIHRAPGEDHVHGPALADQARQADRAAIDQGNTPAAAIDTEDGRLGGDTHVAPKCEFEAARHGMALHRRDHRLGGNPARGAHHALAARIVADAAAGQGLEIEACAKMPAGPGKHRDGALLIRLEGHDGLQQFRGLFADQRRCAPAGG